MYKWMKLFSREEREAGSYLYKKQKELAFLGREGDTLLFRARDMTKAYRVSLSLEPLFSSRKVLQVRCDCPDGKTLGHCGHMVAALVYAEKRLGGIEFDKSAFTPTFWPADPWDVLPLRTFEEEPIPSWEDHLHKREKDNPYALKLKARANEYFRELPAPYSYFEEDKIFADVMNAKRRRESALHLYEMGMTGEGIADVFYAEDGQGGQQAISMRYRFKAAVRRKLTYFDVELILGKKRLLRVSCNCEYCKNVYTEKGWLLCDHAYASLFGLLDYIKIHELGDVTNKAGDELLAWDHYLEGGYYSSAEGEVPPRRLRSVLVSEGKFYPAWIICSDPATVGKDKKKLEEFCREKGFLSGDVEEISLEEAPGELERLLVEGEGPHTILLREESGEWLQKEVAVEKAGEDFSFIVTLQPDSDPITGSFRGIRAVEGMPTWEGEKNLFYLKEDTIYYLSREEAANKPGIFANAKGRINARVGKNSLARMLNKGLMQLRKGGSTITGLAAIDIIHYQVIEKRVVLFADLVGEQLLVKAIAAYGKEKCNLTDRRNKRWNPQKEPFRNEKREMRVLRFLEDWGLEIYLPGKIMGLRVDSKEAYRFFTDGFRKMPYIAHFEPTDTLRQAMERNSLKLKGSLRMIEVEEEREEKKVETEETQVRQGEEEKTEQGKKKTSKKKKKEEKELGKRVFLNLCSEDFTLKELARLVSLYRRGYPMALEEDGSYVALYNNKDVEGLSDILRMSGVSLERFREGPIYLNQYLSYTVSSLLPEGVERDAEIDPMNDYFARQDRFRFPPVLQTVLSAAQKQAYFWIRTLDKFGFGGILADEKGFGKTLEVISVLQAYREEGGRKALPSLVVCPLAMTSFWEEQILRFGRKLTPVRLAGMDGKQKTKMMKALDQKVFITSYEDLVTDIERIKAKEYRFVVADEAQYLVQSQSLAFQAVGSLKARTRLAVTDAVIEPCSESFWSLFELIMPGFLEDLPTFRIRYESPFLRGEGEEVRERLLRMTAPFILRRNISDLEGEVPSWIAKGITMPAFLRTEQRRMHERLRKALLEDKEAEALEAVETTEAAGEGAESEEEAAAAVAEAEEIREEAVGDVEEKVEIEEEKEEAEEKEEPEEEKEGAEEKEETEEEKEGEEEREEIGEEKEEEEKKEEEGEKKEEKALDPLLQMELLCQDVLLVKPKTKAPSGKRELLVTLVRSLVAARKRVHIYVYFPELVPVLRDTLLLRGVKVLEVKKDLPPQKKRELLEDYAQSDVPVCLFLKASQELSEEMETDVVIDYDLLGHISLLQKEGNRPRVYRFMMRNSLEEMLPYLRGGERESFEAFASSRGEIPLPEALREKILSLLSGRLSPKDMERVLSGQEAQDQTAPEEVTEENAPNLEATDIGPEDTPPSAS